MKCLRRLSIWQYDDGSYAVESADSHDKARKGPIGSALEALNWAAVALELHVQDLIDYVLEQ